MAFAASVIRTVSGLEVEVMHAYARIVEGTDPEALHDLRVAARRLRSLLKPLRLGLWPRTWIARRKPSGRPPIRSATWK
ncbi:CHAD domain-containing protein [Pseudomonas aeruginosa]|nr:CHAD domain-containing protein [Pseudomonas aeruginosa]